MKNKLYLLTLIILATSALKAQSIVLEFNANHSCAEVNLDSIWIENLTQGDKMVLYYPDNIAVLVHTHIDDFDTEQGHLYVSQNYPNPFSALTYIDIYLAMPDIVSLNVYDLIGRTIAMREDKLEEGMHRFSFSAGTETTYILNVTTGKQVEKRIMLQMGSTGSAVSELSYLGASADNATKTAPFSSDFSFTPGDDLRFTGYVTDLAGNMDYGVIDDTPETSTEYLFDIANTQPDQPSEISGEFDVPENATGLVYEVEEIAGLTYQWSVPDGWEITQGQSSHAITVNAGSDPGDISVIAENNCGMSEVKVLFVDVYAAVTDIDGNFYRTVIIGNQEWMAENLRVTNYNNGDAIPTGLSNTQWENATNGAYAIYPHGSIDGLNSDAEVIAAYGKLYNWFTVVDERGLCPEGWSVPHSSDWTVLTNYIVNKGFPNNMFDPIGAGNALKSCRQVDSPLEGCNTSEHPRWESNDTHHGFNEFDFFGLPGGSRWPHGSFLGVGIDCYWWTASELHETYAFGRYMHYDWGNVSQSTNYKSMGYSIRCFRDITEEPTLYNLHLEVHPENTGTVSGEGEYQEGAEVIINAIANEGWEFVEWTGDTDYIDNTSSPNTTVTMPAENISLTANFQVVYPIYGDGVIDIDGNEYLTVIIGNQEWMAENLRVTKYNNGDTISTGLSDTEWQNTTDGAYAIYPYTGGGWPDEPVEGINSDEEMVTAYGKLYNWFAVDDARGLCPAGWSVPGDDDWTQFVDYVVAQGYPNEWDNPNGAGNALKSCRQVDSSFGGECDTSDHPRWNTHGIHKGLDAFGFSALPAGLRWFEDGFYDIGIICGWWSNTDSSSDYTWSRNMYTSSGSVTRAFTSKRVGFSIRCVNDTAAEPTLYNLQFQVSPDNSGSVTGAGEYEEGTEVSINAIANDGWVFVEWTGDTDYIDNTSSENTTVTMPAENISLTANFQVVYPIYGDGVIDIDGNDYLTVIIGNQEWMAENLRVTKYNNGDTISTGLSDTEWQNTTDGAYAIYPYAGGGWPDEPVEGINSDEEMVTAYGKLYNWFAVDDVRGLCPAGWSVPGDDDWTQLVDYLVYKGFPNSNVSNGAGNALKSCRQVYSPQGGDCDSSDHPRWNSDPYNYGFDEFGFSALPGGYRDINGGFYDIGYSGMWWSSYESSSTDFWYRFIGSAYGTVYWLYYIERIGFSVRCVKNIE